MSVHLMREMERLNNLVLEMCAHLEQNVRDGARAFLELDPVLADRVIAADQALDRMELTLSEECLKTLALHQPVAGDLRFIFSLAKICGILERIGDLAENLARKGKSLSGMEPVASPVELGEMADLARKMLRDGMNSLVERDSDLARRVIKSDSEVNRRKHLVRKAGEEAILRNPDFCRQWLTIIAASRNLERIADLSANIAAEVVSSVQGKVIRHGIDV
jgi:phosphate transport system protein